jgi:acyl-CoA reductase-like NAD-dependent aldehyde dehydrogenase
MCHPCGTRFEQNTQEELLPVVRPQSTTAALVTGNVVVIKPSDQTPMIASRFMDLLIEAGLPPGVAILITGPGGTVSAAGSRPPTTQIVDAATGLLPV